MNIYKFKSILVNFIDRAHHIYGYDFELIETSSYFIIVTHLSVLTYHVLDLLTCSTLRHVSFGHVGGFIELYIDKSLIGKKSKVKS